jgi:hypothetical protein
LTDFLKIDKEKANSQKPIRLAMGARALYYKTNNKDKKFDKKLTLDHLRMIAIEPGSELIEKKQEKYGF